MDFSLDELNIDKSAAENAKNAVNKEFNPFAILGVPLNASSLEIREAYLRLKSTFQSTNDSMYSLMSQEEAESTIRDMDRAYDELRDIDSRGKYLKKYDPDNTQSATRYAEVREQLNIQKDTGVSASFNEDVGQVSQDQVGTRKVIGNLRVRADKVEGEELQTKLKNILAESESGSGKTIAALREAAGLDRKAIEFNTKVSYQVIEAVESDDFVNLPAPVYVRGFLKSFFRFLAMGTQTEFIDTYTERLNSAKG